MNEIERLRRAATRALAECCDYCVHYFRLELQFEERCEPWPHIDPEVRSER